MAGKKKSGNNSGNAGKSGALPFVSLENVSKTYVNGEVRTKAADEVSFFVNKGELAVVVGESGAGKTTVLNMIGGIDFCDSGKIIVNGSAVSEMSERELMNYRRSCVGFVFQFYNLIKNLNTRENVMLASEIAGSTLSVDDILKKVGLEERAGHYPAQLSGGEQQRVSIARALAKNPRLLLCDEPTGALDYNTGKVILRLIQNTVTEEKMTVILVTHNQALAAMANRVIRIKSGTILSNMVNERPVPVDSIEW